MKDVRGCEIEMGRPPKRVVSLVPSVTETLFELGAGDAIVGVTDWCIFPRSISVPRLGGTKNPKVEEIRALRPDLVHMNLEENLEKHAKLIEEFAPVFVTEPKSPREVPGLLEQLGTIHGVSEAASRAAAEIERELARPPRSPFTFAVPIWKSPWMWCGGDTYVSALFEALGGTNVLAAETRYPSFEVAEVCELRPDLIALPDEPFVFTENDARELASAFSSRVVGPFPGHLATWHGTRTLLGLRLLRELLAR